MKIYKVTIEVEALVMAEDEYEARECVDDILDNESKDIGIYEISFDRPRFFLPRNWAMDTLIYHNESDDISVAQAIEKIRSNHP